MKELDRIKDLVYNELDDISNHVDQLDKGTVCVIGDLVDILKDIETIYMFEEGYEVRDDEYSLASGRSKYPARYYYDNGYRGGNYGGLQRRNNRGGYSRDDAKEHMIMKLEDLMNDAQDEHDRHAISKLVE